MPHYFSIVWTLTLHIFYLFFYFASTTFQYINYASLKSYLGIPVHLEKTMNVCIRAKCVQTSHTPHPVLSSKFRLQIISQNFLDATCAFFIFTGHASRIFCFWKYYSPLEKYCSDNNQNLLDLFPVKKKKGVPRQRHPININCWCHHNSLRSKSWRFFSSDCLNPLRFVSILAIANWWILIHMIMKSQQGCMYLPACYIKSLWTLKLFSHIWFLATLFWL